jgi:hypothetical protein
MLPCCLHENKGPALYLAPDPHLAQRVCGEAANLGLAVVSDPESGKFIGGQAICVTTMRTVVNGRTRFGLAGPRGLQPIRVGSIVVDDATLRSHSSSSPTVEGVNLDVTWDSASLTCAGRWYLAVPSRVR